MHCLVFPSPTGVGTNVFNCQITNDKWTAGIAALKGEINVLGVFLPQNFISLERSPKHLSSEHVHPIGHGEMLLILLNTSLLDQATL